MSVELVVTTSSPTDPSTAQYDETFGQVLKDYEKLMGQDHKPTNFESDKAVLEVLGKTVHRFEDYIDGNQRLKTWLESYVDLLFTVSATLWENTEVHPSPEQTICNAIVVLIETAFEVDENYKSLVELFDRLQFYLQRVYDFYGFTELSNTAGIKLLLLKVMAEALSTVMDYIKAMRKKPKQKVLKVLARKKDIKRILMPHRMDTLTNEKTLLSVSRSAELSSSATPTGEGPIRDTKDNLDAIQEVGYQANDDALAPPVVDAAKNKSTDLAPPEDDRKAGSKNGSKISLLPSDKLQDWLTPPDPHTATVAAYTGTGKWFIQSKAFRWWKGKEKGASLLICGEPGSGKTTLCATIIEEVNRARNKKSEIVVCYHFDSKKPDKRDLRGLLASLITQLCESSKRRPEPMPTLYTKCRNGSDKPNEAELTKLLNHFLVEIQAQFSIYIVIDGIDHCMETESTESPRKKVLKFLEDLVRSKHPKLNICITSSLKEGMEKGLKPIAAAASSRQVMLHLQEGQIEDIKTYITSVVRGHTSMRKLSDEDKDKVIKTLSERAGGIFGWISHRLNALPEVLPEGTLPQASVILEEVGTPRDEEFAQALHDIPDEKYQYAVRLFQCLVAAIRPLSLKELVNISAELDSNAHPHEDAVLSACPALIAGDKDDPTKIVQFFHHESVKEFLTSNRLRTSCIENSSRYHFHLEDAHATLARACINVLLRFDRATDKTHLKDFPVALYAAEHWVKHIRQGPQGNAATESPSQGVMERLFDPNESHLEAWIWLYDVDKGRSRTIEDLADSPSERRAPPLYYVALCGFTELVKPLVKLRKGDLHDSNGCLGTPLHAASYKGHSTTVLALLGSDPDSKMVDKIVRNKSPLHAAYYGRQLKTMDLLLEKGAEVDTTGAESNTTGAELDTTGASGNTLLHRASFDGRLDEVKLLLKYEADINAKNKNGWTPLHRAALRGRLTVADYLLNFTVKDEDDENPKVPVDVNAQSNNKNTPLHVASIAGRLEIVELLLGHNANRGLTGEHGWTPLQAANENRHKEVAGRLLRGSKLTGSDLRWGFDRLRRYYPGSG